MNYDTSSDSDLRGDAETNKIPGSYTQHNQTLSRTIAIAGFAARLKVVDVHNSFSDCGICHPAVAAVACFVPPLRASRVNPANTLRAKKWVAAFRRSVIRDLPGGRWRSGFAFLGKRQLLGVHSKDFLVQIQNPVDGFRNGAVHAFYFILLGCVSTSLVKAWIIAIQVCPS